MRVTPGMMTEVAVRNLNVISSRLSGLQEKLTSGRQISRPSDDPAGTVATLEYQANLSLIGQYQKNVQDATSWLNATDQALGSASDLLTRARTLAVQGASGTLTLSEYQGLSSEVSGLLEQAIAVGNSTIGNRTLFSGQKTGQVPFAAVGNPPASVSYNGDSNALQRQIGDNMTMSINITGGGPFSQVFTTLIALRDKLAAGDSAAVSQLVTGVDAASDGIQAARVQVGAKVNRLDNQSSHLDQLKLNVTDLLSKTQDVDYTSAIVDYTSGQQLYQAALQTSARSLQNSLLDYLK